MILFYSDYCEHCTILLDTIKRHDKNKIIKLLSIDYLRTLNKPIDNRIHSVPALMFLPSKEIIYGKAVFDHLLLPNRGLLFINDSNTRDKEKGPNGPNGPNGPDKNISISSANNELVDEPLAFSLGSISSDYFSNIEEDNLSSKDKNYNWTALDDSNDKESNTLKKPTINIDDKISNKLPTMEEILQQREKDIK